MTKSNPLTYTNLFELASQCGGGFIPPDTCSTEIWSHLLGVDQDTVNRYVNKYRIPHLKPGRSALIKAADMERHLPLITHGEEEATTEGRRKPAED